MARVRGETFAQKFGGATNLQVFREPFGELFRRERLVFVALDLGVDGGRERAALQQDEGRGRAGEVRVALQAVRRGFVPSRPCRTRPARAGDLEDLQLVFEDQGEQPLVGTRVDVELDGEVRERASCASRSPGLRVERQDGGELVVLHARGAGQHGVHDPSLGHDDAPRQALVGPQRVGEANAREPSHERQQGVAQALVAVTGTAAGTFFTQ